MGTVAEVKPSGVLAMNDNGELDWKVCNHVNHFIYDDMI